MKKVLLSLFLSFCLVSLAWAQPESSPGRMTVTEIDGSPICWPWKTLFSNGTVTCNADGTVTVVTSGGGGVVTFLALTDTPASYVGANNFYVKVNAAATALEFTAATAAAQPALLDSTQHTDTTTGTVLRGDIIVGQTTPPEWTRLGKGTAGAVLTGDGTDTLWSTYFLTGTAAQTYTFPTTSKTLAANDASNLTIAGQAIGDIPVASSTTAYGKLADVAVGQVLISGGVGAAPSWSANPYVATIELGAAADTTLARTGAGIVTIEGSYIAYNPTTTIGDLIYASSTATPGVLSRLADVAAGSYLRSGGVGAAPLWSTLLLPNAGTAFKLAAYTATNTLTELAAVGATGQLLVGATGAIPAWSVTTLTEGANTFTLTNGSTALVVSSGGTLGSAAFTAAGAYQAADAELAAIAGLTFTDASIIELTGASAAAVVASGGNNYFLGSNAGNTALEFKTPAATLAAIGAQATDADLTAIAALTATQGHFIIGDAAPAWTLSVFHVPIADCALNQIWKTNASGDMICAADDTAGAPAWDTIGDPTAPATLDFVTHPQIITSQLNAAGAMLTLSDTVADLTADVSLLDLKFTDDGDANGFFIRGYDNTTDLKWSIAAEGAATFSTVGATTFTGALTGNASTASALAADPANCAAGQIALGVTAAGVAECTATPSGLTSVGATTFTGALTGNASTSTTTAGVVSADADPGAVAGALVHHSVITGLFTGGALRYYNGAAVKQLIDMTTATAEGCTEAQAIVYDASADLWKCGSVAAGNAATMTVADTADTTTWVALWPDTNGTLAAYTDTGLTYNADTHILTATGFSGPLTGNASSSTYASATTITDDTTTAATMYPVWVTANTGNLPTKVTSTKLTFNPSTGMLTATGLTGPLTGTASLATALAANGANCSAGSFPLGVDSSGAVESCTDAATQAELDAWVGSASITTLGTISSGIWSGTTVAVNKGGTGLTSGTSGGVLYYSATGTLASSSALAQYGVIIGGGAGAAPYSITPATTATHALFATATAPNFRAIATSDLPTILVAGGGTGLTSGTEGGIPWYTTTTAIASSALLASNAVMVGGGIDAAPNTITSTATSGYVLTAQGAGVAPVWATPAAAVAHDMLSAAHSDSLAGTVTAGDIIIGNATPKWSELAKGAEGTFLRAGAALPAWSTVTTPNSVALGSVLVANTLDILTALTSTSGDYFLRNNAGVISWGTPAGAGDVTAVGDCADGACLSGLVNKGTYIGLYNATNATFLLNNAGVLDVVTTSGGGTYANLKAASLTTVAADGYNKLTISNNTAITGADENAIFPEANVWKVTQGGAATEFTMVLGASASQIKFAGAMTSGGIPYASAANTLTSTGALTQYGVLYGGGAGNPPVAVTPGTTGQVLAGTTGGAPVFTNLSTLNTPSRGGTGVAQASDLSTMTITGAYPLTMTLGVATSVNYSNFVSGVSTYIKPSATTIVPLGGDINAYITAATAGDTLILSTGTYTITSAINLSKQINLVGQGNAGLVSVTETDVHGTRIYCVTDGVTMLNITSSNVRIAHMSVIHAGATASIAIGTATNLDGLVITNMDVIMATLAGAATAGDKTGFDLLGTDAILRDVTFRVLSTNGTALGVYAHNTSATTGAKVVDVHTTNGYTVGGGTRSCPFWAYNNNDTDLITLNLYNSTGTSTNATANDWGAAATSTTSNAARLNVYSSTLAGGDYDLIKDGTNVATVYGGILVNNTTSGTPTYGGTVAASAFTGTITNAANVAMLNESTDTTCFPAFLTDSTPGNFPLKTVSTLTFNSNTGLLSATGFAGALNGTVGATTPAAGLFTTLGASGAVTMGSATVDTGVFTMIKGAQTSDPQVTFTLSADGVGGLTIATANGSNGDITLTPSGGDVVLGANNFSLSGYILMGADPAETGAIRLSAGDAIGWEGTTEINLTNVVNTGLSTNGTFSATTLTASAVNSLTLGSTTGPVKGSAIFWGATSGSSVLSAPDVAGSATAIVLPSTAGTLQLATGSPAGFIIASQAIGDLLYASSTTAWARLGIQAAGYVLAGGTTPAWSNAPQITTIELGAATDTTIARSAAGIITVEGAYVAFNPATTIGDIVYASSTATPAALSRLAAVATGSVLASAGTGTAPAWSSAPQLTTIELGAATDTTLSRLSAGVIQVEGVTVATVGANTFTGVQTFTPAARASGALPYFKLTIPTDTAQTAATESPGFQTVSGTRTWATTGTVALQREYLFAGPTYASASASQTFTDAVTLAITPPIQGTNAIFTRAHSLAIVDATSAATSITGGLVVATALGTTATSVGIGGGNINAGGTGTFGGTLSVTGHTTFEGVTSTGATGTAKLVYDTSPTLITPVIGVATGTSLYATGVVDGLAPIVITATSAGYTISSTTSKSGYFFTNPVAAAATFYFTLPTAAAGLQYCVGNGAAKTGTVRVTATGSGIIDLDGTNGSANGWATASAVAGNFGCFIGMDATHWKAIPTKGTWTIAGP